MTIRLYDPYDLNDKVTSLFLFKLRQDRRMNNYSLKILLMAALIWTFTYTQA